jgi:chromate reductase
MTSRVLVFAGSARTASFNKRLARAAADAVHEAGGEATLIDLADFPIPLYNGDLETRDGVPENAQKLKALFVEHAGLLIASPENNGSVSALLKNTLDWISRPHTSHAPNAPFTGKVAALVSASPGMLGGLRGLVHLRAILENREVWVLPKQYALAKAPEAFEIDGRLKSPDARKAVADIANALVHTVKRLA